MQDHQRLSQASHRIEELGVEGSRRVVAFSRCPGLPLQKSSPLPARLPGVVMSPAITYTVCCGGLERGRRDVAPL
jgi:hypothetical protein